MGKIIFTIFQTEFILSNFADFSNKELANSEILKGITSKEIHGKGHPFGLKKSKETRSRIAKETNNKKETTWTKNEIELLKKLYPYCTNKEILEMSEFKDKTTNSLINKAMRLKVQKISETRSRARSEARKGKPKSEEHKKKLSEVRKRKIKNGEIVVWNKGKTAETDLRVAKQAKDQYGENNPNWKGGHINRRGPNWNTQRKKARKRDSCICQICRITQKENNRLLDVHHLIPFREFGIEKYKKANELLNLTTLCHPCHMQVEKFIYKWAIY